MSLYDQLAFASKPNLYLAAPTLTDQSNSSVYTISSNSLALGGQPIIRGHEKSFKLEATANAVLNGNPVFKTGVTTEFVVLAARPEDNAAIILADNGSGVWLTPYSIMLSLTYDKNGSIQSLAGEVPIVQWNKKLHVVVTVGENQATLTVNGASQTLSLDGVLDSNITETTIGAGLPTGYSFLLDGLGVYTRKLYSKDAAIDDQSLGHNIYAASIYAGTSTNFDSFDQIEKLELGILDLTFTSQFMLDAYLFSYKVPIGTSYVSIEVNDDTMSIDWDINNGEVNTFSQKLVVPIVLFGGSIITFRLGNKPRTDFKATIRSIRSADIVQSTPALLLATGQPIFPEAAEDSIVNVPHGVDMTYASWAGTWLTSDRADLQVPPQSVELIFRLEEDGVIFASSEGTISTTAQSGYNMWLNGVPVTDLTNILMNQWNHLVLVKSSAAATEFTLNTDGSSTPTAMQYLLMTGYFQELDDTAVANLYKVSIGADDITIDEVPVGLIEGSFDNGQPFQLFGNTWAIVGTGGN
jgi:hypothetical protein